MQQDSHSPPPPSPDYEFIFKDEQKKPAAKFRLPLPNLPKPILLILGGLVGLMIIIIFYSLIFGGRTSNTEQIVGVIGRAEEIARVSDTVGRASQDSAIKNLAATTQAAMASDSATLTNYLKNAKVKVDTKKLKAYANAATDTEIQTAQQNNNLSAYYISYLKTSLTDYANTISQLYKNASVRSKPMLQDAFNNAKTILNSSQVTKATVS